MERLSSNLPFGSPMCTLVAIRPQENNCRLERISAGKYLEYGFIKHCLDGPRKRRRSFSPEAVVALRGDPRTSFLKRSSSEPSVKLSGCPDSGRHLHRCVYRPHSLSSGGDRRQHQCRKLTRNLELTPKGVRASVNKLLLGRTVEGDERSTLGHQDEKNMLSRGTPPGFQSDHNDAISIQYIRSTGSTAVAATPQNESDILTPVSLRTFWTISFQIVLLLTVWFGLLAVVAEICVYSESLRVLTVTVLQLLGPLMSILLYYCPAVTAANAIRKGDATSLPAPIFVMQGLTSLVTTVYALKIHSKPLFITNANGRPKLISLSA